MNYLLKFGIERNPFIKNANDEKIDLLNTRQLLFRLRHLEETKGIGLITGEPGLGKSTTIRHWAKSLNTNLYKVIYISHSTVSVHVKTDETREVYSRKYAFTGILYCSYCGSRLFKRTIMCGSKHEKQVWACTNHIRNGKASCPDSRQIEQFLLENTFVKSFNKMVKGNANDIDEFIEEVGASLNGSDYNKGLKEVQDKISKLEKKKSNLLEMRADDLITKEELTEKLTPINNEMVALRSEETSLINLDRTKGNFEQKAKEFKNILLEADLLDSFDRTIFESAVDRVMVGNESDSNAITIVYKHEYTTGERVFKNENTGDDSKNHQTYFCVMNDDESRKALDYINSNVTELFTFDYKHQHFTFIPNKEENKLDKILRNTVPVRVMITTK